MNFCKGAGKEEEEGLSHRCREGPREELDRLSPSLKIQPESPTKYWLKNTQEKRKEISTGEVAAEGTAPPRTYPVTAARSR